MGKLTCPNHADREVYRRGFCWPCYLRMERRGTTVPAFPPSPTIHVADRDGFSFDPTDPRHGERQSYVNFSCRCLACTEANNIYIARYRA